MMRLGYFIRDGDKYVLYSQKAHRELDVDSVDWLEIGRKTVEVTIAYEGCKFVLYRERSDKLGEFGTIYRAVDSGISHIRKEVTSLFG